VKRCPAFQAGEFVSTGEDSWKKVGGSF